jgi:hypothetical protein
MLSSPRISRWKCVCAQAPGWSSSRYVQIALAVLGHVYAAKKLQTRTEVRLGVYLRTCQRSATSRTHYGSRVQCNGGWSFSERSESQIVINSRVHQILLVFSPSSFNPKAVSSHLLSLEHTVSDHNLALEYLNSPGAKFSVL